VTYIEAVCDRVLHVNKVLAIVYVSVCVNAESLVLSVQIFFQVFMFQMTSMVGNMHVGLQNLFIVCY
jgi:hypothetical protein